MDPRPLDTSDELVAGFDPHDPLGFTATIDFETYRTGVTPCSVDQRQFGRHSRSVPCVLRSATNNKYAYRHAQAGH
jgi:hypothetical protein